MPYEKEEDERSENQNRLWRGGGMIVFTGQLLYYNLCYIEAIKKNIPSTPPGFTRDVAIFFKLKNEKKLKPRFAAS